MNGPILRPFSQTGIGKLRQFVLLRVSGTDAESFLQGQLTNDIKGLLPNRACLAGYCTAKGRLLATLLVWRQDEAIMLQVPSDIAPGLQKRLQMFVMRSKVTFEPITDELAVAGLIGGHPEAFLNENLTVLPVAPYDVVTSAAGTVLRLTDAAGLARYLWVAAPSLIDAALANNAATISDNDWALSEIHAGIPHVLPATQEKFVPQMVNLELIGGVSFKKGCYPGQEIVARTHYLGKQKRRTVLAHIAGSVVQEGTEVFAADDPTQPCGIVVNAAVCAEGGNDCLIEIKSEFYRHGTVQTATGDVCQWLTMPYALPDDVPAANPLT